MSFKHLRKLSGVEEPAAEDRVDPEAETDDEAAPVAGCNEQPDIHLPQEGTDTESDQGGLAMSIWSW